MSDAPELTPEQIDVLRLKAFRTNLPADRDAYFNATSKWFQDRHYRDMAAERADLAHDSACVGALRAIADLVNISGRDFAEKHPKLNAELDAVSSDRWGEAIAEFASAALAAKPQAAPVRVVTVEQLERWVWQQPNKARAEIRAIIAGQP